MAVVSASLPEPLVAEMDAAIAKGDYKGRSEFLRAAIRSHLHTEHGPRTGHAHGSITLTYPHDSGARFSDARHAYDDVVLSLMHTHCGDGTCLDVLLVGGDIARIRALHGTLQKMREIHRCELALMQ